MEEIPSKPYLIRALHDWCTDNGYTPYINAHVSAGTRVPRAYVRNGQITLNISTLATQHLTLDNETITFQARFGGVSEHVRVPVPNVLAIYARETGIGMEFAVQVADALAGDDAASAKPGAGAAADAATSGAPPASHTSVAQKPGISAVPPAPALRPAPPPPAGFTPPQDPDEPPRRPKLTLVK